MKKRYISPEAQITHVELNKSLLGASMVKDNGSLGEEYIDGDVSYVHPEKEWDIWSKEEEEYEEYADY